MGWRLPPLERQKHRVCLELRGPVDKRTWARYRAEVQSIIKKYGASLTDKKLIGRAKAKTKR